MPSVRRAGLLAAIAATPLALAYRFALVYRVRAGYPRRRAQQLTPADRGLAFEETVVRSPAGDLPAWFIPAAAGASGPGVVLVHGWESNRDRTIPNAQVLHAAGFHCLAFDVRGHGSNAPEPLPISVAEFGADATAALDTILARPEVTRAGMLGHSLGAVGTILAAAADPDRVAALVSASAPADPRRLTRQTFRLARLPIPEPFATPLAWLTTRVYVRPRGHDVGELSASRAIGLYPGPIMLVHGALDSVVPIGHFHRLVRFARQAREDRLSRGEAVAPLQTLVVAGGRHSWLYEDESYRRAVARFLVEALGGPLAPGDAAEAAAAVEATRIPDPDESFAAIGARQGNVRTVAEIVGAARPIAADAQKS